MATEILKQTTTTKKRSEIISFFLTVAKHCVKLNNYNSSYAIKAGLSNAYVARLKKTWKKIPKKQIIFKEKLDSIFSSDSNFKSYKNRLFESSNQPFVVIPYLGLYSKYIFAIEENHKTFSGQILFFILFIFISFYLFLFIFISFILFLF